MKYVIFTLIQMAIFIALEVYVGHATGLAFLGGVVLECISNRNEN